MAELRLTELIVENFRSISGRCVIPLDGSITLIHGANGAGKTSLLSALELAATGRVGFLEDQKKGSHSYLRNHDFPLGRVRLSLSNGLEVSRVGAYELNGDRTTGNPALEKTEQTYFLERSFLPQTALGRLLESYTDTGKDVDTALVRFVKSLVGLDGLDALIDGLHASGDRRRSKKLVPAWNRADDELALARQRRLEVLAHLDGARGQLDAGVTQLRELVNEPEKVDVKDLLNSSIERARGRESSRAELARLEELQAMVDAVGSMRRQAPDTSSDDVNLGLTLGTQDAEDAFEKWRLEKGTAAIAELNRIRQEILGLQATSIDHFEDAYDETFNHVSSVEQQNLEAAMANRERADRIGILDQEIRDIDLKMADQEARAQAIEISNDVRVLIQILELTIPLAGSKHCPVCDERFTGEGSLNDHLSGKFERLSAHSTQLLSAERDLTALREKRLVKVRQVIGLKSVPWLATGQSMDETIRSLNGLGDRVSECRRLRHSLRVTQASLAEMSARAIEQTIVTGRVADIAKALDISTRDLPPQYPEETLGHEIQARIQRVRHSEIGWLREGDARELIEDGQRVVQRSERDLREIEQEIERIEAQLSTAESRMAASRELLQIAERTRSRRINEVFDQSLNMLWSQLFGRFAPTERFTPRFVKQQESSRSVDVRLETQLPGGETSGSPGAMLSYGNTNSAALALFMALHLSAPSQLPWLILDDPVQSMDDIHIANFAAIVRQLAFVHDRQVVIAIHEPELFDYLSLELAPSNAAQSLVRVNLDRSPGVTNVIVDRVEYVKEPLLYQRP